MPSTVPARRRPHPAALAIVMALALAAVSALPVLGKMWIEAWLDDPIAFGTPDGVELLVGVNLAVPDGIPADPVAGQTVVVVLIGGDGGRTAGQAVVDADGHADVRVVVPNGGVRDLEIVMAAQPEVPLMLTESPFTFGPIAADTAQLAPPLAAEPAPVAVPAGPGPDPAGGTTPVTAAPEPSISPVALAAAAGLAVLGVLLAAVAVARRRVAGMAGAASAARDGVQGA